MNNDSVFDSIKSKIIVMVAFSMVLTQGFGCNPSIENDKALNEEIALKHFLNTQSFFKNEMNEFGLCKIHQDSDSSSEIIADFLLMKKDNISGVNIMYDELIIFLYRGLAQKEVRIELTIKLQQDQCESFTLFYLL